MLYKTPVQMTCEIGSAAGHYYDTVNSNIQIFLEAKRTQSNIRVQTEDPRNQFTRFWASIGADGNLDAALKEWDTRYNALPEEGKPWIRPAKHE